MTAEIIVYILIGSLFFIFLVAPAIIGLVEWLEEIFKN